MNRTAGIKPFIHVDYEFISELKQNLLLFDLIGIPSLNTFFQLHKAKKHRDNCEHVPIIRELEYLIDNGLVFPTEIKSTVLKSGKDYTELNKEFDLLRKILYENEDNIEIRMEAAARATSLLLNNEDVARDFTSIPLIKSLSLPFDSKKSEVLNLIIEQMPIPNATTPWEAILESKNNPDNKGKFSELRNWINKSVRSEFTIQEIKDELESLIYQYRKSLEIHKIKYDAGILQTFIVGSAELLENAVRLKFSNIARGLFSASQSQAELLMTELTSPGNEISYIYKATETFIK